MGTKKVEFDLRDLLFKRSQEINTPAALDAELVTTEKVTGLIDVYKLIPSKENFYNTDSIQDLKQSIELLGVLQPLLLTEEEYEDGKRGIIAGHRRNLASIALVEEGKEQFRYVPYITKPKKNAILDRLALIMSNRFRDKTDWERMKETLETEELVIKLKETMDIPGQTRDLLAEIVNSSPTQIARYKVICKNLSHDLMAEFQKDVIGISVAYEAAGLNSDYQIQAYEILSSQNALSLPEVRTLKKKEEEAQQIPGQMNIEQVEQQEPGENEKVEPEESDTIMVNGIKTSAGAIVAMAATDIANEKEFDPKPNNITSICYSCLHWNECNIKSNTVTDCDTYINKAEAEKTEEQRYLEEQDQIDRETAKKLKEMQDNEKMQHLPSDDKEVKEIVLPKSNYEDITSGILTFLLLKNDKYKVGQDLDMKEYDAGEPTGRVIDTVIRYVLDDCAGLIEGYCIIGFGVICYDE